MICGAGARRSPLWEGDVPQPHRGTLTPLIPLSLRAIKGEGEGKTKASACTMVQALASSLVLGEEMDSRSGSGMTEGVMRGARRELWRRSSWC